MFNLRVGQFTLLAAVKKMVNETQLAKNGLGIPESHTLCQVLNGQTEPRLDNGSIL